MSSHASRATARLLLSAALALPLPALAQSALLRDLHPGQRTVPSSSSEFAALGNTVFFLPSTPATGSELWRTDGTPAGTTLVADLVPGPQGSGPGELTALDGTTLLFTANTSFGAELWRTDGTPAGTVRLLSPGSLTTDAEVYGLTRVGGTVFFTASMDGRGAELWKTDGTPAGTVQVKDLAPGAGSSRPFGLSDVGGTLFFGTSEDDSVWKSDGTAAGTVRVWPTAGAPSPGGLEGVHALGTHALFQVRTALRTELWKTDGSAPVKLAELPLEGREPLVAGGRMFLWSYDSLWVTDGTPAGTRSLKRFAAPRASNMVALGGTALFLADDDGQGLRLWKSDGTAAGTVPVKDVRLQPGDPTLAVLGGAAYFFADDAPGTLALWKSDGTAGGTGPVGPLQEGGHGLSAHGLRAVSGQLLFNARRPDVEGSDGVWRSDGTLAGTGRLASAQPEPLGSSVEGWVRAGGTAWFAAEDGAAGRQLWRTDGTPAGTSRASAALGGGLRAVLRGDGTLYLLTQSEGTTTLWKSDGTEAGTVQVKRIPGSTSDSLGMAALVGDTLYFAAEDAAHGAELWKSDGTEAGTVLVKDLVPGAESAWPHRMRAFGGALYFTATDNTHGTELWKSDGTAAGTVLVKDILPGEGDGMDEEEAPILELNGALYFQADDGTHGTELWKSDGTAAGTVLVKDLRPGSRGSDPYLFQAGNLLYLMADDGEHGYEPWKSDGTEAGTALLKDIVPGVASSYGLGFAPVATGVLFLAYDAEHGMEPWRTDGTEAGTTRLKDVFPGSRGGVTVVDALPQVLALEDRGLALFAASDGVSGEELWMTDGTAEGTQRVVDLAPGAASSAPRHLARLGDKLLLVAMDAAAGREPHALPLPERRDLTAPALTCPAPVSATTEDAAGAPVTYAPASGTDDRGAPTLQYSHASGTTFPVGTTAVTVTASDAAGNRAQCAFDVTVTLKQGEVPVAPSEEATEGCGCGAGGSGLSALWGLLALGARASLRRRRG